MTSYQLLGLNGSFRKRSFNRMALDLVQSLLPPCCEYATADFSALPFYCPDRDGEPVPGAAAALNAAVREADGLVIACPEYNHSLPAALKNAIDWLSRMEPRVLEGKPVMILSAATGILGGARVQYELRRVLDAVGALPLVKPEVFIGLAQSKFDATGRCVDPGTRQAVERQLAAFWEWIERHNRTCMNGPAQDRPEPVAHI
jgi:chromate reductase